MGTIATTPGRRITTLVEMDNQFRLRQRLRSRAVASRAIAPSRIRERVLLAFPERAQLGTRAAPWRAARRSVFKTNAN